MSIGLAVVISIGVVSTAMAEQESLGKADAAFLQTAAQRQQSEIQWSQLAVERSESEQVKQFAQRMVQDHTKAIQEISKLAAALSLTISETKKDTPHRAKAKLSSLSGRPFERAYLKDLDAATAFITAYLEAYGVRFSASGRFARRLRRLKQRIDPDSSGESVGRSLARRL